MTAPVVTRMPQALGASTVAAAAVLMGVLVAIPVGLRVAIAVIVALPLAIVAFKIPRAALYGLVAWLVALGLVRRLISGVSPKEAWGDPLIIVGAAAWMILLTVAMRRGALSRRGHLTNAVLLLWALLAMSALNPLQGGLDVGVGGGLLVVVPMSAFLVGRGLIDDEFLSRLLWLLAWLGLAVATYGLLQTFWTFPVWDEAWISHEGYSALNVGGVIRAFASFSSASEYASFLGLAVVAWLAHARSVRRWPLAAGALVLLATALWFESSRGAIVLTVASIAVMLAARAGVGLGRALLLGVAMLSALPLLAGRFSPAQFSGDVGDRLAEHQVEGLADPFGESSTLPVHLNMMSSGVASAIREPLGIGVGATTVAADRFGTGARSTEGDPGNAPLAAGIAGLAAYAAVVLLGVPRAYRLAAARRDAPSLAALGVLTVTFLQWLNGGQYAVVFWPWLVLGWVDMTLSRPEAPTNDGRRADATT